MAPGRVPRTAGAAHTLCAVTLFKAASTVSLLTLASRVTGLVRDLLMASVFGASGILIGPAVGISTKPPPDLA